MERSGCATRCGGIRGLAHGRMLLLQPSSLRAVGAARGAVARLDSIRGASMAHFGTQLSRGGHSGARVIAVRDRAAILAAGHSGGRTGQPGILYASRVVFQNFLATAFSASRSEG